jgi:photosynthetic reaction center cytochrome c subunit
MPGAEVASLKAPPIINTIILVVCAFTITNQRTVVAQQSNPQPRTAGNVFKNIKVLREMPASQLQGTMSFISASLGVDCSYCHMPPAMEKDDKTTKQTARRMMLMMNEINKNFGDKTVVNCATCHRGQTKPAAIPPLPTLTTPFISSTPTDRKSQPTVDQILDRYIKVLGGNQALEKIKTRTRRGSVEVAGLKGTFELHEAAPNKSLLLGSLPPPLGSVHQAFDGTIGWVKNQNGVFEMRGEGLTQAQREADFFFDIKLKEQYKTMSVVGRDRVGNREFYVIEGTRPDGQVERLFFDVESGLLVRRYWEAPTYFGQLPNSSDFDSYRKVGNVWSPFVIRRSRGGQTFLQTITELKLNAKINESIFKKPIVQK